MDTCTSMSEVKYLHYEIHNETIFLIEHSSRCICVLAYIEIFVHIRIYVCLVGGGPSGWMVVVEASKYIS